VKVLVFLLTTAVFAALVPCPVPAQIGSQSMFGVSIDVQVRYPDGSPGPPGIHVLLERGEGGMETDCVTIQGGKCRLQPGSSGVYMVRLNMSGYAEVSERAELVGVSHTYVTLTLRKLDDRGPAKANSTVLGNEIDVSEENIPENARQEYAKGKTALQEKKPGDAEKHFQKALKQYEKYPEAYRMLGEAYLEQQDFKKAEAALQRSIELEPRFAAAYVDLGAVRNQTKDYAGAEQALKKGLELSPDAAAAKYELAKTYWALGRWQEAAPYAMDSVKEQPQLAAAHVLLGNIRLKQHNPDGALAEYQEYLRLAPDGPMAPQVREIVTKLQGSSPKQ
jgi:tetratricopeptide (TPR) repeat protein